MALLDGKTLAQIWLYLTKSVAFNNSKEKTISYYMSALARYQEEPSTLNNLVLFEKLFENVR